MDLTTKSTKKLTVEPPAMVGMGLCSVAIDDVSYDSLKTWVVRPAREPNCTVTHYRINVTRVLIRSDGKVHDELQSSCVTRERYSIFFV